MAESYTAGRLLVAVVPDMRGVAAKVRKEFSGLGPYDVQVTAQVNDKALAGLRAALRSLPDVVVTADTSPADRNLAALRARMTALGDHEIGVSISAAEAHREVDSIRADLASLADADVKVDADVSAAQRALGEVSRELSRVSGRAARIKVDADTGRANAALIFTQNLARRVGAVSPVIRVTAITEGAISGLTRLAAMVTVIGGLGGMLGGLAGALGGIGAAAAVAGLGVAAIIPAFLGVGKAIGALNDQQANAGQAAAQSAKAQQAAAQQVESAQRAVGKASEGVNRARIDGARAVSDAERNAARNVASALQAQEDAQRQLVSANRDARMAQQELTRAWEDGRRALEDLQDQVDNNALDQRQAAFDLADARKALQEAQAGGNTDQIARAQLAYDRVIERVDQLNKRTRRGNADNAKAQAAGVAGTDQYRGALDRVQQTQEAVADAQRNAARASAAVDQARADGARDVQRAQMDAARSVSDAQAGLVDAQRQLTQALAETATAGTEAGDKVAQAFANLSPAAAAFARYLFGLKPILNELSAIAAAGLFPPLIAGIDTLLTRLPLIKTVTGQLAAGMGAGLNGVLTTLANPWWASFFATLGNAAGTVIPRLFQSLMTLAQAAGTLILAFLPFTDVGLGVLDALSGLIAALAGPLAQSLAGMAPAAHALISALGGLGPLLLALSPILNALGVALGSVLAQALSWLTTALIAAQPYLLAFAEWARANPDKVLMIAGAIVGLVLALRGLSWLHTLLGPLTASAALFARVAVSAGGLSGIMTKLGGALRFVLGPWGLLIGALVLAYTTSAPFRDAVNSLVGALFGLVGALAEALLPIFAALMPVITSLVGALATMLVPVISALAGWITFITPVLVPMIGAFLGIVGAVRLWAIAQTLLNVAMNANPIVRIIMIVFALVAAVVWAYQNFEGFRNVVNTVWSAIQTAFSAIGAAGMWLWHTVLVPAFTATGAAAMWLWTNAIKPAFDFIGLAARVLIAIILTVLVTPLMIAWNAIAAVSMWLWANVIQPVFQAIGTFIGWVWNTLIKPYIDAWMSIIRNFLAPLVMWLWTSVIQPAFNAIGTFIGWVWNYMIKPYIDAWMTIIRMYLAPLVMWLWNTIVKPAFEGIGSVIKWVWENVIRPAFDAVSGGLDWLGQRFTDATNWIRDIWNRIKGFLAKPINFMIDWVWNKGVVPAWNAVAALVGLGPIQPLGLIPEARTGGRVDSRGMIHGPGTGTSDSILGRVKENDAPLRVSNREFIMNERATKANLPALTAMNGGATIGDRRNERRAAGFAGGGPVWQGLWDTVRGRFPNARLTSAHRPGDSGYHGKGMAVDVAGSYPMAVGQMIDINKWIAATYPESTQLIHYPITGGGINLLNGGPHQYNWATQAGHANHVHWAQDPAGPGGGGNGGAFGGISTYFIDAARAAFDGITNPMIDKLRGWIGQPPPAWREVVPALATKMRDTVRDFVFRKANEKDAEASAGATMGATGHDAPAIVRIISDVARGRFGGQAHKAAVTGTATGLVESNLTNIPGGDRDSVGVFQQRPSMGWGTIEQIMNVTYAAGKFFSKFPGNWASWDQGQLAQHVQRSAFPLKYGQRMGQARALVDQHGGFDNGGKAFGKGIMFKDVMAAERVLDPEATEDYDVLSDYRRMLDEGRLVPARGLDPRQLAGMGAGAPGGREMHLHVHGDVNDPMDVDSLYNQIDFRERSASL